MRLLLKEIFEPLTGFHYPCKVGQLVICTIANVITYLEPTAVYILLWYICCSGSNVSDDSTPDGKGRPGRYCTPESNSIRIFDPSLLPGRKAGF